MSADTDGDRHHDHDHDHDIVPGLPLSSDDVDDTVRLELEFLTSLIWAPDAMTTAAVHAVVGTANDRSDASDRHLPLGTLLFLRPAHGALFATIVARVDAELPVTPTLVIEGLGDPQARAALREVMLDVAAPGSRGPGPLPGGADVPHLATALLDRWYRRGYLGLIARMSLHGEDAATDALAGHWAALTEHQQRAERRWSSVRTLLARL